MVHLSFMASELDENSLTHPSPPVFLGQNKTGDVGLRDMLNDASSVGQAQWPCFIK
jgi:hypothetical protein